MVWVGDVCQVSPNRTFHFNNDAFTSPVSGFIVVADRPTWNKDFTYCQYRHSSWRPSPHDPTLESCTSQWRAEQTPHTDHFRRKTPPPIWIQTSGTGRKQTLWSRRTFNEIKKLRRSCRDCEKKEKHKRYSTCGDAVKGLRHQIVDLLVQLWGRPFTVNLIHCGIGAVYPLHQPLQLTVAGELVPSQVSEGTKPGKVNPKSL